MGIFNKLMANIGIGSASVDTIIENSKICAGDEIRGYINIKGGKIPQKFEDIYIYVMTKVEKENNNVKYIGKEKVQKIVIPVSKTISSTDDIKIPFNFILSKQTPITTLKTPVWIHTGLDIKSAIDPKDNDSLQISPHPYFQLVLNAIERLELIIYRAVNVEDFYYSSYPFLQEIEFRPTGSLKYELENLKLLYVLYDDHLELIMEVNKLHDEISLKDMKTRLSISYNDLKNKDPFDIAMTIKKSMFKQNVK
ncbi:MAG: sporulation protein [Solirubrobacterales bacterium]